MEKIKLVIVDDELTSRNTIKKYLEQSDAYEVIADFSNAKSALDWIRKNSVDILLCDMQMPEMNGVELMRNIHIIDEYLPVIVISGFDDFNFVRGSLINGAANYLLKHELTKEHLLHALDQVREQYRIMPKGKAVYHKRGYVIHESGMFQTDVINQLIKEEKIDFCGSNVCALMISPDYKIRGDVNAIEYKKDVSKAVIDIISQILGESYPYLVYVTKEYHIAVLVSFAKEKSMLHMINTMNNMAGRLQRMSIRMLDITLSVVCGDVHTALDAAIREVDKMHRLVQDKFYFGENYVAYAAVSKPICYSDENISEKYWKQLRFELQNNMLSYVDTISSMLDWMEQKQIEKKRVYHNCVCILNTMRDCGYLEEDNLYSACNLMEHYENFGQFRALIMEVLHRKAQDMRREKKQYSSDVAMTIEYINENFASDISLEKCAEVVGCSYTSLSKEFKKETGIRFVEYLNQQRVNKAKSLLIRQDVPMKEIVELSGFRNYNYFFKVFKEIAGITPSEFATKK